MESVLFRLLKDSSIVDEVRKFKYICLHCGKRVFEEGIMYPKQKQGGYIFCNDRCLMFWRIKGE